MRRGGCPHPPSRAKLDKICVGRTFLSGKVLVERIRGREYPRHAHWSTRNQLICLHTSMCNNLHMATNPALDDKLIEEAQKAGHHRTKKDAVTAALAEYVKRHKQQRILEAFGSFEFDPGYDYKAERRRRR